MENKVKLCKDCKWYACRSLDVCCYPGKAVPRHREIYGRCKVQAISFKEKTTLASTIKRMYNNIVSYLKRSTRIANATLVALLMCAATIIILML